MFRTEILTRGIKGNKQCHGQEICKRTFLFTCTTKISVHRGFVYVYCHKTATTRTLKNKINKPEIFVVYYLKVIQNFGASRWYYACIYLASPRERNKTGTSTDYRKSFFRRWDSLITVGKHPFINS